MTEPCPTCRQEWTPPPEGLWCFGCNKRFVAKGQPTSGPLSAVRWREGLCGRPECGVLALLGVKTKKAGRVQVTPQ